MILAKMAHRAKVRHLH